MLTNAQKRGARIAAMVRTFERTAERAAEAMRRTRAEIERSRALLDHIAHRSPHDARREKRGQ